MFRLHILFALGGWLCSNSVAPAATNSLVRNLGQTVALTNSLLVVSASFTNSEAVTLRGFYYAEQLPSGLEVTTISVKLNGQNLTNYTFASGLAGDVDTDRTPYRWILERPRNFTETNPIPPQANVQIIYAIQSARPGTFALQPAAWIGFDCGTTNGCFGFEAEAAAPSVSFLATLSSAPLSLSITNGRARLAFATESNVVYVVEYRESLTGADWITLTNVTGSGTTVVIEDAELPRANRFYRTRLP